MIAPRQHAKIKNYARKEWIRGWELDLDLETKQQIDEIVKEYISATKSWPEDVYKVRVEWKEARYYIVVVSHQEDRAPGEGPYGLRVGGAGKSVLLHVDLDTKQVVRELRFQ